MQEQRRRRWLELDLLSLSVVGLLACGPASPARAVADAHREPASDAAPAAAAPPAPVAPAASPVAVAPAPTATAPVSIPATPEPEKALPTGTLVLHVGDSFAAALGVPLAKRLKAAGLRNIVEFKTASYIPTWAFGPELKKFVTNYNPDLVLITLGANELEIPDPPQRVGAIKKIVATVGTKPCVWISPPLWKKDTGLLEVIRENVGPCRYLDSDSLVHDLPRGPDKIHPSTEGREMWAEAVFSWLGKARDPQGPRPWALRADGPNPVP
ncbi:MAG TPA: SGNH/GDSL hydrolase family protein [Polyangiaceae bacterium]|nr:SGNH/GDSL hydrolase family protein [Polyangiaceae bacterium]